MDELVEGVLAIGARLSPHNGSSRHIHPTAVTGNVLTIALHVPLLQVGRKAVQVLVVGEDRLRLGVEEIVIPDAEQSHNDGQVLRKRRRTEVLVQVVGTGEQLLEVLEAEGDGDGKTDCRPQTVATAHPVPELEHVRLVNAEFLNLWAVRRDGDEVLCDTPFGVALVKLQHGLAGRRGVEDRLLGREGLARNDKERLSDVDLLEHLREVRAVDVRHKVHLELVGGVGLQGLRDHHRAEVAAADANVDHVGNGLAAVALPLARADLVRECFHLVQYTINAGHHVDAVHEDRAVTPVAQSNVQHSTALRNVDFVAAEHHVARVLDVPGLREVQEQLHGLLRRDVLGVVQKEHVAVLALVAALERQRGAELGRALLVSLKQSRHAGVVHVGVVLLQLSPLRRLRQIRRRQTAVRHTSDKVLRCGKLRHGCNGVLGLREGQHLHEAVHKRGHLLLFKIEFVLSVGCSGVVGHDHK
eukprot:PhM_4_TR13129/c0_g1_i1/m.69410